MNLKELKRTVLELENGMAQNRTVLEGLPPAGNLIVLKKTSELETENVFFTKKLKEAKKEILEKEAEKEKIEARLQTAKEAYQAKEEEFEGIKKNLLENLKKGVTAWQAEACPLAEAYRVEKGNLAEIKGIGNDYIFSERDHVNVFGQDIKAEIAVWGW